MFQGDEVFGLAAAQWTLAMVTDGRAGHVQSHADAVLLGQVAELPFPGCRRWLAGRDG